MYPVYSEKDNLEESKLLDRYIAVGVSKYANKDKKDSKDNKGFELDYKKSISNQDFSYID